MGLSQFDDAEIRRIQAIDPSVFEALEQLQHITIIRPRGAIVAMHIEIQHHPADVRTLIAP
ncbi:hypothetical protein D9M71_266260 [compost metagenome]